MRKLKRIIFGVLFFFIVCILGFLLSCTKYYRAVEVDTYLTSSDTVLVTKDKDRISFLPKEDKEYKVLIFYPGAQVEESAYSELCYSLAEAGNHVYLVHMPLHYAFFGMNKAEKIREEELKNSNGYTPEFYLMGHSLGGAMAGSFIAKHSEEYTGIIFLASFTTSDLSQTNLKALSIYGSLDSVLNLKSYKKNQKNLPVNSQEFVIEGGNHAGFASYGAQKKDTQATISNQEQIHVTRDKILEFIQ